MSYTPPPAGTAPLGLGGAYTPPPSGTAPFAFLPPVTSPPRDARLRLRFPAPRLRVRCGRTRLARLHAHLSAPRLRARGEYDLNLPPPLAISLAGTARQGRYCSASAVLSHRDALHVERLVADNRHALALILGRAFASSHRHMPRFTAAHAGAGVHRQALRLPTDTEPQAHRHGRLIARGPLCYSRDAAPLRVAGTRAGHVHLAILSTGIDAFVQHAARLVRTLDDAARHGTLCLVSWDATARDGAHLPGVSWLVLPPAPPPSDLCYTPPPAGTAPLALLCRWLGWGAGHAPLALRCHDGCWAAVYIIPIREVYQMPVAATLRRLPDGAEIPATSVQAAIDLDSWAWALDARVPGRAAFDMLDGAEGIELEVQGRTWRGLMDSVTVDRAFAAHNASVNGRSRVAVLADPLAAPEYWTNTAPATLQQLALAALDGTGVGLDWTAEDWTVPAGLWALRGTPIEALTRLAEAAGATVQAHRTLDRVAIAPRYALPPWEWDLPGSIPDLVIPAAVVTRLGWRDEALPVVDVVYVSGETQGVIARVRRAETAGLLPAEMVVDPLIMNAAAARARGIPVLARSGLIRHVTLELPLSPIGGDVPLLYAGQFVQVEEGASTWRGQVSAVTVAARQQGRALSVRQTVEITRHVEI